MIPQFGGYWNQKFLQQTAIKSIPQKMNNMQLTKTMDNRIK
jgi:hypothetical protein